MTHSYSSNSDRTRTRRKDSVHSDIRYLTIPRPNRRASRDPPLQHPRRREQQSRSTRLRRVLNAQPGIHNTLSCIQTSGRVVGPPWPPRLRVRARPGPNLRRRTLKQRRALRRTPRRPQPRNLRLLLRRILPRRHPPIDVHLLRSSSRLSQQRCRCQ